MQKGLCALSKSGDEFRMQKGLGMLRVQKALKSVVSFGGGSFMSHRLVEYCAANHSCVSSFLPSALGMRLAALSCGRLCLHCLLASFLRFGVRGWRLFPLPTASAASSCSCLLALWRAWLERFRQSGTLSDV